MKIMTSDRGQGTAVTQRAARPRTIFEALFRPGFPEMPFARDFMNVLATLPETGTAFVPTVELSEKDGNYVIDVALPGFKQEDIDVEVSGNEITVGGTYERKEENKKTHYSEMQQASFSRTVVLPKDADPDKVSATFENGMLHITAPPVAPISAKKVAIKGEA